MEATGRAGARRWPLGLWYVAAIARDQRSVDSFGFEWTKFDQAGVDPHELDAIFESYFDLFPWGDLPDGAAGFDLGCGSGRWASRVLPRVGAVVGIDPSRAALRVARRNTPDGWFVQGASGTLPFGDESFDFGYSLGVLHHTPDPAAGLRDALRLLRPGAPFLVYLYYALDNRPRWFRALWRLSDLGRGVVSRCPPRTRYWISQVIAAVVYWPLARMAVMVERAGGPVERMPLSTYRHRSFYIMRNDALDRFGTPLERRFTRAEISALLDDAGFERVVVDGPPYWSAVGYRPSAPTA